MYEVRPSAIHGHGLFATRPIAANTVLGQLQGHTTDRDGPYVLWLDETQGFRVENDLKYINHDPTPNAVYYDDLTVVALRDIQAGEEITHHYDGDEAVFDDPDAASPTFDTADAQLDPPMA